MKYFFKLTTNQAELLREHLTASEWRLWSYFVTLDPFGSQFIPAPDLNDILAACNISRATYYRALDKFETLNLFEFGQQSFCFRNLYGSDLPPIPSMRQPSHACDIYLTVETKSLNSETTPLYVEDQILTHLTPRESTKKEQIQGEIINANELSNLTAKEADKTVFVSSEILDQLEENPWNSESEKCSAAPSASVPPVYGTGGCLPSVVVTEQGRSVEGITVRFTPHSAEKPEESAAPTNQPKVQGEVPKGSQEVNQSAPSGNQKKERSQKPPVVPQQPPVTPKPATEYSRGQGFGSPPATERSRSQQKPRTAYSPTAYNWLPDGPWKCDDGKLDPHFHDWLAQDWAERYGGDKTRRRADVLLHFKKDPANLVIRWAQYQEEYVKRFQNTQTLINHGRPIPPDYQEELTRNHRALTTTIPPEISVTRSLGSILPPSRTDTGPVSSPSSGSSPSSSNPTPPPGAENGGADKTYQRPESFPDKQEAKAIFATLAQKAREAREAAEKRKAEQFSQTAGGV